MVKGRAGGGNTKAAGKSGTKCIIEPVAEQTEKQASSQGNESVNKPKTRKRMIAGKVDLGESSKNVTERHTKIRKIGKGSGGESNEIVFATFVEDGDMVDIEVRGQSTDFNSETEEGE